MANSNYKILLDAQISTASLNKQLSEVAKKYKGINIGSTAKEARSVTDNLYSGLRNFNNIVNVIETTVGLISNLTSSVFDLNKSLIEFQKVSDLSGDALDKYTEKASKLGETTARTAAQMIEGASEFRKSGFTDEDSLILSQTASLFQNVADSELSASDAATVIISNLKAFNMTAQDSSKIIDVINEISNSYAVSSTDLTK